MGKIGGREGEGGWQAIHRYTSWNPSALVTPAALRGSPLITPFRVVSFKTISPVSRVSRLLPRLASPRHDFSSRHGQRIKIAVNFRGSLGVQRARACARVFRIERSFGVEVAELGGERAL